MPPDPSASAQASGSGGGSYAGPPPVRVLFVCTANICRSAFAEQWARHLLGERGEDPAPLEVSSAGTHGFTGRGVERHMAAQLVSRGASPDGFSSRRLEEGLLDASDLVVTMEAWHRERILQDRPDLIWRCYTLGQLARVIANAPPDLTGHALVAGLRAAHRPPVAADDVEDPYRRGRAVYTAVSARLEDLLDAVLPRLMGTPPVPDTGTRSTP